MTRVEFIRSQAIYNMENDQITKYFKYWECLMEEEYASLRRTDLPEEDTEMFKKELCKFKESLEIFSDTTGHRYRNIKQILESYDKVNETLLTLNNKSALLTPTNWFKKEIIK